MGKPYSQDLRERVIAAVDTGTDAYAAALMFQARATCPRTVQTSTSIEQFFAKLKALLRRYMLRYLHPLHLRHPQPSRKTSA